MIQPLHSSFRLDEGSRRLAGAWFVLALVSLGISALLALVLVAARTPFLGFGSGLFRTALVLHVDMAVLVWFLAAAAGAWVLTQGRANALGWGSFWVSAGAVPVLLLSPLLGEARPILANYLPMLDSGLFKAALAAFGSGVLATALGLLVTRWPRAQPLWQQAGRWSATAMLLAALVFIWDGLLRPGTPLTLDQQTWGAGHLLQFLHTLLMLGTWSVIGERLLLPKPWLTKALPWLLGVTMVPVLGGLLVSLLSQADSDVHRWAYTELMRWGTWPAAVVLGAGLLHAAWRDRAPLSGEEKVLLLSVLLFMAGCMVGAGIRGEGTLSVPAHYHGTVGAVTLTYLLLARRLAVAYGLRLPAAGWPLRLPLLYGLGISVLVAGLAWSGWLGVARKAPHAELLQAGAGYLTAMGLAGLGGLLALTSVLLLVAALLCAIARHASVGNDCRRVPYLLLALTPLAIGLLLPAMREQGAATGAIAPDSHVREKVREEIDLRFKQGVAMLHARQYDHALTAFYRVLQLSPDMPETHANIGFALLGKQQFGAAAESFDRATTLRPDQINAYYGMAVAMEGLQNKRAAVEAMRAYLHRASADDPYRVKAEAAIWEWQEDLRKGTEKPASTGSRGE